MNAHVEIEPRVLVGLDDLSCSLDDMISHLVRQVMIQADEIARMEDRNDLWGAFQRLRDQHDRVNDAFKAARLHVVNVRDQRNRESQEQTLKLARAN